MLKKNNVWENLGRMCKTIDEMIAEYNQNGTITNYVEKRREINVEVIEAAVGIVFEPDKKGGFKGKLGIKPSNEELLEIQSHLNKLFDIESKMTSGDDQDAIPGPNYVKLSKDAKIKDIYAGLIGNYGLINRNVGCGDVIALAAVGDTLRKKYRKRNAIIIGSVILATVAGGTVAYVLVKKHNKKDEVVTSNDTTSLPEPEVIDMDTDIVDLDDGEIVDLDEEAV